ncbi:MAG TPA: hypothetical protein VGJ94_04270 [Syntrophorhabdaceae bacterium]|jgi:hypothetical protein
MSDGISQADLDALFAGFSDPAADTKTEEKKEEGGLCQADLDALFAGITDTCAEQKPEVRDVKKEIALKMEEACESPPPVGENTGESLSQEDIDKMLAEFGIG